MYLLMAEEHHPRRDGMSDFRQKAIDAMAYVVTVNGTLTDVASIGFLQPMIRVGSGGYCGGSSKYLKFIGLNLDGGQNNALEGFFLLCLRPCAVYRQYRPQYRRIGHRRRWLRLFGQRS